MHSSVNIDHVFVWQPAFNVMSCHFYTNRNNDMRSICCLADIEWFCLICDTWWSFSWRVWRHYLRVWWWTNNNGPIMSWWYPEHFTAVSLKMRMWDASKPVPFFMGRSVLLKLVIYALVVYDKCGIQFFSSS